MNANSQNVIKTYDSSWKKVENFVKKGLPKSALEEARKIYALSRKEKQDAQMIKSLIYISLLQEQTREENELLSIKELEQEAAASKGPVKSILQSIQADIYWNYYQAHRYQFYSRTQTVAFAKDDVSTWTAENFHKKISELYLASLTDERLLQQTKLLPFEAIIIKGNVRSLRPTLYDLLAQRALLYFSNDERDVNKPAYKFEIDQAAALDPAADFVNRKFLTKDSLSLQHKALLIYQELIRLHLTDQNPAALIDVDLQRIQFVHNASVHPDKEEQYFNAINHIAHQYESTPAASQAWYLVAMFHEEKADTYDPFKDTTHRYDRLKA